MGLDLWFREDVQRILLSAHETMQATMSASARREGTAAYEQGFVDALRAVALAFGLNLSGRRRLDQYPTADPWAERLHGGGLARLDIPREWRE
jgi:hypothetical protein